MDLLIVLLLVLGAVVILRGPKMLPKLGEALGRTVKDTRAEFQHNSEDDDKPVPPA